MTVKKQTTPTEGLGTTYRLLSSADVRTLANAVMKLPEFMLSDNALYHLNKSGVPASAIAYMYQAEERDVYQRLAKMRDSMENRTFKPDSLRETQMKELDMVSKIRGNEPTFTMAIDGGTVPKVALAEYLPGCGKDITRDRLKICVEGGLTFAEITRAFGVSESTMVAMASRVGYKLKTEIERAGKLSNASGGVIKSDESAINQANLVNQTPKYVNEAVRTAPSATVININTVDFSKIDQQSIQKSVMNAINPKPADTDEFIHVFDGARMITQEPLFVVRNSGEISLLCTDVEPGIYSVSMTADFRKVKLERANKGLRFAQHKHKKQLGVNCMAMTKKLKDAQISVPVRYSFDQKTMIGVMI